MQCFNFIWVRFFALFLIAFFNIQTVQAEEILDADQAFRVNAKLTSPEIIEVQFMIADAYYLYKDRLKFSAVDASLGIPEIPPGKVHFDDGFQKNVETFRGRVTVRIPVKASKSFVLKVTRQGCADKGVCYPPLTSSVSVTVP